MACLIRLATPEDAAAVCAVVRRSIEECCAADHRKDASQLDLWLKNKTVPNALAWLQNPRAFAVAATVDDAIVGFAMSQADELQLCYLAPEARFQGMGKSMLQAVEAHALETGVVILRLESTRTALPFYERNGFRPTGPVVQAFGITAHPMVKTIPSYPAEFGRNRP
jgi:GNAT superfamily N-acetyltransferase